MPGIVIKRLLLLAVVMLAASAPTLRAADALPSIDSRDLNIQPLLQQAPGLRGEVLRLALAAVRSAEARGLVRRRNLLTIIDYSIPSSLPRLFVFDLAARKLLFRELVAHGKGSGGDVPTFFSNGAGSLATSVGLFITADPYIGHNGYSLRLQGLERGINDMAWSRAIVLHGATYVSQAAIDSMGRLGRSWGCPAVRQEIARTIIDTLRGGSPLFAYYPEPTWLRTSAFLPASSVTAGAPSAAGGSR